MLLILHNRCVPVFKKFGGGGKKKKRFYRLSDKSLTLKRELNIYAASSLLPRDIFTSCLALTKWYNVDRWVYRTLSIMFKSKT